MEKCIFCGNPLIGIKHQHLLNQIQKQFMTLQLLRTAISFTQNIIQILEFVTIFIYFQVFTISLYLFELFYGFKDDRFFYALLYDFEIFFAEFWSLYLFDWEWLICDSVHTYGELVCRFFEVDHMNILLGIAEVLSRVRLMNIQETKYLFFIRKVSTPVIPQELDKIWIVNR